MILNFLVILKTVLYIFLTEIKVNSIIVLLITSLITISILELINKTKLRSKNGLRLFFYIIFSVIMFADTVYYTQFNTLPSVTLLKQLGLLSAVGDSVKDLLNIKNLLLILDIPILIILFILRGRKIRRNQEPYFKDIRPNYFLFSLGLLVVTLVFSFATGRMSSLKSQEIYLYHGTDLKENLFSKDTITYAGKIDEEDLKELSETGKLKEGKLSGLGKGKNLLVIQVEALQNFVVGMEYEGQEVTPEINKLISNQSTVYYDRYYQLVGRGNTSDAEFVSNNSVHPSMDEPSYTKYSDGTFYALPKLLKDQGYKSVVMHGHDGEYWNRRNAYESQGFDEFLDEDFYKDYEKIGLGVSDEDFFVQNIDYMKEYKNKNNNPFYGFMVTLTSHTPFNMPEKYMDLEILPEHKDTMLGRYINSINYTDKQIGLLIEYLKENELYEDTVIAIYGDHFAVSAAKEEEATVMTEYFGERYDFDNMMNIPLIIHIPGEEINETISNVGSQLDFYPTILNIMGYENNKGLMFGKDITNYNGYNFVNPQTYMAKGSFIDDEHVFVISRDGIFEHSRAYNIKTREEVDIGQFKNTYEKSIEEINFSDYILNNGILKEYILNDGSVDLDLGKKEKKIGSVFTLKENTIEEIDTVEDGQLLSIEVVSHEDQFMTEKDKKGMSLNLDKIIEITKGRDIKLLVGTSEEETKVLKSIYDKYGNINIVPEIKDYESYLALTNNMYKKLILNPKYNNYGIEEIQDFTSRYPNLGLVIDEDIDKYKNLGVDIYSYEN